MFAGDKFLRPETSDKPEFSADSDLIQPIAQRKYKTKQDVPEDNVKLMSTVICQLLSKRQSLCY